MWSCGPEYRYASYGVCVQSIDKPPSGASYAERVQTCRGRSNHPGGNPWANLKSISHRCHLREVAFVWGLTKETIYLPLGCLQGGPAIEAMPRAVCAAMRTAGAASSRNGRIACTTCTPERLVVYCRTTSASTAPRTPRRTCCPYACVLITVLLVS